MADDWGVCHVAGTQKWRTLVMWLRGQSFGMFCGGVDTLKVTSEKIMQVIYPESLGPL